MEPKTLQKMVEDLYREVRGLNAQNPNGKATSGQLDVLNSLVNAAQEVCQGNPVLKSLKVKTAGRVSLGELVLKVGQLRSALEAELGAYMPEIYVTYQGRKTQTR